MIDIVIVNWNSGRQLRECIESIQRDKSNSVGKIIIVDNGSTDNSVAEVKPAANIDITLVGENLGFGKACNVGAARGANDLLLFLNPDTILHANSLRGSIDFLEENNLAVCGIQLIDENGVVSRSCARFPNLITFTLSAIGIDRLPWLRNRGLHMREWDHLSTREVDHVIGAYYLIRRSLFEILRGFDERFFVYLEDLDLSLRVKQAGGRIMFTSATSAFHAGGGTSRQIKARRLFYSLRSRLQYGFKHFTTVQAWALLGVTLLIEPIARLFFSILKGNSQDIKNTIAGYRMLYSEIPKIIMSHHT